MLNEAVQINQQPSPNQELHLIADLEKDDIPIRIRNAEKVSQKVEQLKIEQPPESIDFY